MQVDRERLIGAQEGPVGGHRFKDFLMFPCPVIKFSTLLLFDNKFNFSS